MWRSIRLSNLIGNFARREQAKDVDIGTKCGFHFQKCQFKGYRHFSFKVKFRSLLCANQGFFSKLAVSRTTHVKQTSLHYVTFFIHKASPAPHSGPFVPTWMLRKTSSVYLWRLHVVLLYYDGNIWVLDFPKLWRHVFFCIVNLIILKIFFVKTFKHF